MRWRCRMLPVADFTNDVRKHLKWGNETICGSEYSDGSVKIGWNQLISRPNGRCRASGAITHKDEQQHSRNNSTISSSARDPFRRHGPTDAPTLALVITMLANHCKKKISRNSVRCSWFERWSRLILVVHWGLSILTCNTQRIIRRHHRTNIDAESWEYTLVWRIIVEWQMVEAPADYWNQCRRGAHFVRIITISPCIVRFSSRKTLKERCRCTVVRSLRCYFDLQTK